MRGLLDTQSFLWWNANDPRLSMRVRQILLDPNNIIYFSVMSAWEIIIKAQIGKLILPQTANLYVPDRIQFNNFKTLNVTLDHTLQVYNLPLLHRDPFDRILVAQAQAENLTLLTSDPIIRQYAVQTIW